MSSDRARRLAERWYGEKGDGPLAGGMHRALDDIGFTEGYVDAAITAPPPRYKVLKDNIWGMIDLNPMMVRLVDTPVLQRLRGIRQLGFSYLTYPSAEHSRFAHSLGVYHVIQRFLEIHARSRLQPGLETWEAVDLAHAAVLHDTGHWPFSHVVEKIIEADEDTFLCSGMTVRNFRHFVDDTMKKPLSLSECMTLAVILSPRFRRFYVEAVLPLGRAEGGGPSQQEDNAIFRVACLIAGTRSATDEQALPAMISSHLDADKIDYLLRDAAACGIPVGIDVARLFLRSQIIKVSKAELPQQAQKLYGSTARIFVVNSSGLDTFEEIVMARTTLYHRVYFHQTTRNAECVLGELVARTCLKVDDEGRPTASPDVLKMWGTRDEIFLVQMAATDTDMTSRLVNRQLPKRAAAFGVRFALPYLDANEFPQGIFRESLSDADGAMRQRTAKALAEKSKASAIDVPLKGSVLRRLEIDIRSEAAKIRAALTGTTRIDFPKTEQPGLVLVSPIPRLGSGQARDCFAMESDGRLISTESLTNVDETTDANEIVKRFGYVFTDHEWRPLVLLAMRHVLFDYLERSESQRGTGSGRLRGRRPPLLRNRFLLNVEMVSGRCGIALDVVKDYQERLAERQYFDQRPLMGPWQPVDPDIEDIASRLDMFSGQHEWRVTPSLIARFISQFRYSLRSDVIAWLTTLDFLGRGQIAEDLISALGNVEKAAKAPGKGCFVVPLSKNSGAQVATLFEQEAGLKASHWRVCSDINEAVAQSEKGDVIALVDDNLSSGSQFEAQVLAWLGKSREDWPTKIRGERGIVDRPLDKTVLSKLADRKVALAVCVGNENASAKVNELLAQLGIKAPIGLHFNRPLENAHTMSDRLREELARIGEQLLVYCRWSTDKAEEPPEEIRSRCVTDALGYGGANGSLITMWSVPSSTTTALWCPGIVDGEPWIPLVPRRGYVDLLNVSDEGC